VVVVITKALLTHFACETCIHFSPVTEVVSFRLSDPSTFFRVAEAAGNAELQLRVAERREGPPDDTQPAATRRRPAPRPTAVRFDILS
jgi:hypothetical protein